ncbi:MAG: TrkA C-terminal domain-containing protein, partial [Clostridia bacterium]|nr:TrkA C-terminal domain-containing protein [Clostridia bacterium]
WAAVRYSADHILDFIEIDDNYAIFEVTTPDAWIGKSIGQIDIRKKFGINIIAIKQGNKLNLTVTPDMVLKEDQTMLVLGEAKNIQKCFHI